MVSEAAKRAQAKYDKENVSRVIIKFTPVDSDMFEFLKSKENITKYIKDLIRKDMEA